MIWKKKNHMLAGALGVMALAFIACQKDETAANSEPTTDATAIAVAASATTGISGTSGATDSVYLLSGCTSRQSMAATSLASMPAAVAAYLSDNYGGYTLHKAVSVLDSANAVQAYIVVVYYNDKPVGLKFDAAGNFVQVLEQREKGDLRGKGWHQGGRFQHRNGQSKDSVALSAVPAGILSNFAAAYSNDTLIKAFKTADSGYVLLSRNNGAFATAYDAAGTLISRVTLHGEKGTVAAVDASALPAAITSYLTTTYPGYVFNKAFTLSSGSTLRGYAVVIDANNTRYGLAFDASGNFLGVKTIH